ncbi:hypothetical protein [Luteibacter sp.]|jgi:hypothetical protein|uniref:hypothetical protein n=1 Tax=Luteibacter sp. TaxID=1886636 RepID=UPI002F41B876
MRRFLLEICRCIRHRRIRADADLSISWPQGNQFPWTKYDTIIQYTDNEELAFMRRRLRSILTAFRSHSKGSMQRFADKMEHSRMVKDARGQALLDALLADGILSLVKDSTFYVLNAEKMGETLGVNYQALQKQQYTAQSDAYVLAVAAGA